jgi:hypothetical protein
MLCPCCGEQMPLGAGDCRCGARFVGEPLPESPFKVQRLGPAMTAVAVSVAVAASCRISLWMALGGFIAVWLAWRAVKLAKQDPESYGGYRIARLTLTLVLVLGSSLGIYEISRIPRYIHQREIVPKLATQSAMLHLTGLLEAYKRKNGSYPTNAEALKKTAEETPPLDYWQKSIIYVSYAESAAMYSNYPVERGSQDGDSPIQDLPGADDPPGIEFHNFELRSAGPDGIFGTADDIVMRDGVFCTNPKVIKRPIDKDSPDR